MEGNKMTKQEILQKVKEEKVGFIRLQFTDLYGTMKNVAITSSQLERALDNNCMFDGSSVKGFADIEDSDMYLYPDLDTFDIIPWRPMQGAVARIICDVYTNEQKPFKGDPRFILQRVEADAAKLGYTFNLGPECEFFLFNTDENGNPTTGSHDNATYFDVAPTDQGENARRDMVIYLEKLGFTVEASHHEVAPAQHEIDFRYADALKTADNIQTFKLTVKTIAKQHGLHATFMPKPVFGINGSGMHLNMSISKDGKNIFNDPDGENGLSNEAYSFVAGVLAHIKGITAISNPLINSYKRLVPGYEAPVYISWSGSNRSTLIRVPVARGEGTRIELRSPDPSANPYLVAAVCLAAGLDGIKKGLTPPPRFDGSIFKMSHEERKAAGIDTLPQNLYDAIKEMEKDDFIKEVLGAEVFNHYINSKLKEWANYSSKVTDWEIDRYLYRY